MSGLSAEIGRKIMEAVDYHRREADDHARQADDIDDAWRQHDYVWLQQVGVISKRDLDDIESAMAANPRRNGYPGGDPRTADALNRVFRAQFKLLTSDTKETSSPELRAAITGARSANATQGEIDRAVHDAFKEAVAQAYKPRKRKRTSRRR